ncbi:SH3 domain protein [Anaerohalosphaera lusitana]|uniref:SH3 domain protein n=1 Tax=Anaerohalosphaera lusitana TaxID=1936003 RepID=A0A1U9NHR9_9BACT|nr:hypothetical protein [Anaerohalosphaera lusitana]AQT67056.1 SH3 domain protein [Anaerohalosphaera lusitana]
MIAGKKLAVTVLVTIIAATAIAEIETRPMFDQPPAPKAQQPEKFPYIGKVTGQNVYVRSGPGTAYYFSDKVSEPTTVTVVSSVHDIWLKILPTEDAFSWISADYVRKSPTDSDTGIVTADSVRVYAGSGFIKPQHSSSFQTKLNEGEKVNILGPVTDGYYKIEPPEGAFYYIAKRYVDFVRSLAPETEEPADEEAEPADEQPTDEEPADEAAQPADEDTDEQAEPAEEDETTEPADEEPAEGEDQAKVPTEKTYVLEVQEIARQVEQIHSKPLTEQDYSEVRTQLKEIADNPKAGRAVEYAKYLLDRIDNFELAIRAGQLVERQEQALERKRRQIRAEYQKKLQMIPQNDDFIATGTLRKSAVFTTETGQQRYLLIGDNKRIIAYAVPATPINVSTFVGKEVGLIGDLVPVQGQSIPLIKFIELKVIEPKETTGE